MAEQELNFARTILAGRSYQELGDEEILSSAKELLIEWMNGEIRLERPKLYDHYALILLALIRRIEKLENSKS